MTLPLPEAPRRLVYVGTPAMAVPTLRAVVADGHQVVLVVTRADARRGRGGATSPSPVKAAALELGLPVSHDLDDALDVGADLGIVVAYGRLIKPHVLAALPMVNIHFSLLPRWRGAAPVERALLAGDELTGVCLMDVVDELDAGDVFARAEIAIGPDDTLESLRARLVELGTHLVLQGLGAGFGPPAAQVGEPVYAHKIAPEELHLDWERPADELRRVAALGGAWTTFPGKRMKVWAARPFQPGPDGVADPGSLHPASRAHAPLVATGNGWLELVEVQPEGKGRQPGSAWWNGTQPRLDDRLGS